MSPLPLLASASADALEALARVSVEDILLPVLVQLALLILVARVVSSLFRKVGQPSVVGEIAAGPSGFLSLLAAGRPAQQA
jgi:hypothetical protein